MCYEVEDLTRSNDTIMYKWWTCSKYRFHAIHVNPRSRNAQPVCITSVWNIYCQRKAQRLMQVEDPRSSSWVWQCVRICFFFLFLLVGEGCALLHLFPPLLRLALQISTSNNIVAENLELNHLSRHKVFVWGYYLHTHQGGCNISTSGFSASGKYSRDFATNKSSKYKETM